MGGGGGGSGVVSLNISDTGIQNQHKMVFILAQKFTDRQCSGNGSGFRGLLDLDLGNKKNLKC